MVTDYSTTYYKSRLEDLKKKRVEYDGLWQKIALLCDPRKASFTTKHTHLSKEVLMPKCDDTFQTCLPMFASILTSILCPQVYKWHGMRFSDEVIQAEFGDFLEKQNDVLYYHRYKTDSGFVTAINECWMSAATYGHCILSITPDRVHKRLNYQCLPIREFYIDKNASGTIDTLYRVVEMSYRHLLQMFPKHKPSIAEQDNGNSWLSRETELIVAIEPSQEKSKEFDIVYIDSKDNKVIERKTSKVCPIVCGRNMVYPSSDDPYGFSQAMSVLPSISALNALRFNEIKVSDLMARQTFLAGDDVVNPQQVMSGGIIQGGIDENGRPLVAQLQYQGTVYPLDKEIEKYQQTIKDVLFVNMYLTYQQTQSRSATDAMLKANERTSLLAPIADRLAREVIAPMMEVEMYYLDQMGLLPEAPDDLKAIVQSGGGDFEIRFDNPILKSQKSDAAMGIQQLAQFVATMAQMDNGESFDLLNKEAAVRELQNILNAPMSVLNTPSVVSGIRQQRQQQQAMMQAVSAIPDLAGAAKDFAAAESMGAK